MNRAQEMAAIERHLRTKGAEVLPPTRTDWVGQRWILPEQRRKRRRFRRTKKPR